MRRQNSLNKKADHQLTSREKAEKELGFKYKYSLEDGLKKLIAWREEKGIRG